MTSSLLFAIKIKRFPECMGVVDSSLEFPEGWGATTAALKWKIQRGWGPIMKFSPWWGGMGIFWNYTSSILDSYLNPDLG